MRTSAHALRRSDRHGRASGGGGAPGRARTFEDGQRAQDERVVRRHVEGELEEDAAQPVGDCLEIELDTLAVSTSSKKASSSGAMGLTSTLLSRNPALRSSRWPWPCSPC